MCQWKTEQMAYHLSQGQWPSSCGNTQSSWQSSPFRVGLNCLSIILGGWQEAGQKTTTPCRLADFQTCASSCKFQIPPNFPKISRKSITVIQPDNEQAKNPKNISRTERPDKPHFHKKKTGWKGNNTQMEEILVKHMETMNSSTDLPTFSATCTCTNLLPFQGKAFPAGQPDTTPVPAAEATCSDYSLWSTETRFWHYLGLVSLRAREVRNEMIGLV